MSSPTRLQRRYDHRLRELVCNAKDVDVEVRHGVPGPQREGGLRSDIICGEGTTLTELIVADRSQ